MCAYVWLEQSSTPGPTTSGFTSPRTPEEKAAMKERFLRLGPLPGVIGCVDGSFVAIVAPRGDQKASFWCRKGYYALNVMFICDADMRILSVDPLRPRSDHDSHIVGHNVGPRTFRGGPH
ncbi:hypothetical protein MTO96_032839 [Rhipicephalus appendiculatus]